MAHKLTPIGDDHALIIDKAILELLKITPDTELEISTDGACLIIAPAGAKRRRDPPPPIVVPIPSPPRAPRVPAPPDDDDDEPTSPHYGFPKKEPW